MSVVLVLTPVIICSWPAITAAVVGAAAAMGFTVGKSLREEVAQEQREHVAQHVQAAARHVEVELTDSEVIQNLGEGKEIVLTKGTVELRIKRDARGKCTVCASGKGRSDAELEQVAQQFAQKMTQCYVYNRVMTEMKAKGFQVVNEEQMQDETVRIHVRRWED